MSVSLPVDRSSTATDRGVTPAVAVVLMIAITLALVVVVVPIVFSVADDTGGGAPTIDLAYVYGEDTESEVPDTFGQTGETSDGDGMITIIVERGERLDAENIRIESDTSGGNLADATSQYDVGDTVNRGDEITVWAKPGEQIDLIWTTDAGDESYILDTFTVRPSSVGLPPGITEVDYDCENWSFPSDFDDEDGLTAGSGDLTVDGVVLRCDLDQFNLDNVDIVNSGAVIGNVQTNSDIDITDGAVYDGFIEAGGTLDADAGSTIKSDVDAATVDLDAGTTVDGDVDSSGDVDLQNGAQITGDLEVSSGSTLDLNSASILGTITLRDDSEVNNLDDSFVGGSIDATDGNKVVLTAESTVNGHVEVQSGDDLDCNDGDDSTINGEGCLEYKAPEFLVTIDRTNSPVEQGNTLNVTAQIENTGLDSGTQTVTLDIDGVQNDSQSVSLDGGKTTAVTLEFNTFIDTGTYTANVSSDDDSDTTTVEVKGSVAPRFDSLSVTLESIKNFNNKADRLEKVSFDYTLNKQGNVTFEVEKNGNIADDVTRTGVTGETYTWDHSKTRISLILRAKIPGEDCYEIRIESGASQGDTHDMIADGEEC